MPAIRVSTVVEAPVDVVWEDLRHIGRHTEWMSDAASIRFLTDETEGVGVRFECLTQLGPIRLLDVMEVTEWVDARSMGITHRGIVTGRGRFELRPGTGPGGVDRTEFVWTEDLQFPWWMAAKLGAFVARPILRLVWKRNLEAFAARF